MKNFTKRVCYSLCLLLVSTWCSGQIVYDKSVCVEIIDTVEVAYDMTLVMTPWVEVKKDSIGLDSVMIFRLYTFANNKRLYLDVEFKKYKHHRKGFDYRYGGNERYK